jgi:hypothetical protein
MTQADMGGAPPGKQAFRKAYNREIRRQASEEIFTPKDGEIIPPRPRRNQWNRIELTPELKEEIVERVASGELLKNILNDERMPSYMTVHREEERDPDFGADMRIAKRVHASILVDEVIEISDNAMADIKADGSVNHELIARSKIRTDNRKWLASKLDPVRFSEKVQTDITSGGERIEAKEVSPLESARQVAFALELARRATGEDKS